MATAGNSAGDGARIALLNKGEREDARRLARWTQYIGIAMEPRFQDAFVEAMPIPHASDAFPHLAEITDTAFARRRARGVSDVISRRIRRPQASSPAETSEMSSAKPRMALKRLLGRGRTDHDCTGCDHLDRSVEPNCVPCPIACRLWRRSRARRVRAPARDEWSVCEIIGHMCAIESPYRARLVRMTLEDNPRMTAIGCITGDYDPDTPVGILVETLGMLRRETVAFLENLPAIARGRPGIHAELGPVTLRNQVEALSAHDEEHVAHIAALLRR